MTASPTRSWLGDQGLLSAGCCWLACKLCSVPIPRLLRGDIFLFTYMYLPSLDRIGRCCRCRARWSSCCWLGVEFELQRVCQDPVYALPLQPKNGVRRRIGLLPQLQTVVVREQQHAKGKQKQRKLLASRGGGKHNLSIALYIFFS